MDIIKLDYPDYLDRLKSLVNLQGKEGASLEVGTGFLKAGVRMPDEGESAHLRHEVSIILEGELETTSGGKTTILKAGDIVSIPALQKQSSIVTKDVRLVYIFFGTKN